jgi:hypothetical protein
MTFAQLTKWGERYNLTLEQVLELKRLINKRVRERTHHCNGDPHPHVSDRNDKNACSEAWDQASNKTEDKLEELAKRLGFDDVDFGVGLYPVLEKDNDTCIMVP